MEKETFSRFLDERIDEIQKMSKKNDYNNLIYHYTTPGIRSTNVIEFRGLLYIFKEIKNGDKTIQGVEKKQIKFNWKLGEIKSGNPRHKIQNQKATKENVQNLCNSKQIVFDLFNDYSKIRSEAIYKSKQDGTELEGMDTFLNFYTWNNKITWKHWK